MFTINCKGHLVLLDRPLVMGIINVTADSFYADSRHSSSDAVLFTAEKMIAEGADIIDIGGLSTSPGNIVHSEEQELESVTTAVEAIAARFPDIIISADTYRSKVADYACNAGASIINDISGGYDTDMYKVAAKNKAVYILMHSMGTPFTIHEHYEYDNILTKVVDYFVQKTALCHDAGIKDVIIDIGIGFSKTIEQNYFLLKNLEHFRILNLPVLVGLSRKSFIYKSLNCTAEESLNGTTALNFLSLNKGADILRVHDVKEAKQLTELFRKLEGNI